MFHVVGGSDPTSLIFTIDLMLLYPYFHGITMIPCKLSRLLLEFKGGADAYLLGKKIGDKEIIIFKKELVNREPDINACGDK